MYHEPLGSTVREPFKVDQPLDATMSLILMGMPSIGLSGRSPATRLPAAAAASRWTYTSVTGKAFKVGSMDLGCGREASMMSSGAISRGRKARNSSITVGISNAIHIPENLGMSFGSFSQAAAGISLCSFDAK